MNFNLIFLIAGIAFCAPLGAAQFRRRTGAAKAFAVTAAPSETTDRALKIFNNCFVVYKKKNQTCYEGARLLNCLNHTQESANPTNQAKMTKRFKVVEDFVKACIGSEGCGNTWAPKYRNGRRLLNCVNARWLLECGVDRDQVSRMVEFCDSEKIDMCLVEFAPRYVINCQTGSKLHKCLEKVKGIRDYLNNKGRKYNLEEHIENLLENNDCGNFSDKKPICARNETYNMQTKKCEGCPVGQIRVENWGHESCDCEGNKVWSISNKVCEPCLPDEVISYGYNGLKKCDCGGDKVYQLNKLNWNFMCKPCQGSKPYKQKYTYMRAVCSQCSKKNQVFDYETNQCSSCPAGETVYADFSANIFCGCKGDKVKNPRTGLCQTCPQGSLKTILNGENRCDCLGDKVLNSAGDKCEPCPSGTFKTNNAVNEPICGCKGDLVKNPRTGGCQKCPQGSSRAYHSTGYVCRCLGLTRINSAGDKCENCPSGTYKRTISPWVEVCECPTGILNKMTKNCEACPAKTRKYVSSTGEQSCKPTKSILNAQPLPGALSRVLLSQQP